MAHPVFKADKQLKKTYECGDILGSGAFAEVRRCMHLESGEEYAIKIVKKKHFDSNPELRKGSWIDEVNILKDLDHPSIVKVVDVFDSPKYICIVMELVRGGDLFDAVVSAKRFTESKAKNAFRDMCHALKYLHDRDIVHRDIKPENFLVEDSADSDQISVKMGDFGLAKFLGEKTVAQTLCGTPQYLSPEVIHYAQMHTSDMDCRCDTNGYGKPVDIWSLGCVIFILLAGYSPFNGESDILTCNYKMHPKRWNTVSLCAKDLVQRMLVVDPKKRYTVEECLKHEWLTTDGLK